MAGSWERKEKEATLNSIFHFQSFLTKQDWKGRKRLSIVKRDENGATRTLWGNKRGKRRLVRSGEAGEKGKEKRFW